MSEFDPIKALTEEIAGVNEVIKTLTAETRKAEMAAGEAATHYEAMLKLQGFARGELARKQRVLAQLREEAERRDA